MQQFQQQLEAVTSEKVAAEASNQKLKQENDSLKKQVRQLTGSQTAFKQRAEALQNAAQRGVDATKENAAASEKLRGQLQELIGRYRELAQNLKAVETERSKAGEDLAARNLSLQDCTDRNQKLYQLDAEILDKFQHRGFWSGVAEREPFTQIAHTRLENLVDDTQQRANDLRLPQGSEPPSRAPAAGAPTQMPGAQ